MDLTLHCFSLVDVHAPFFDGIYIYGNLKQPIINVTDLLPGTDELAFRGICSMLETGSFKTNFPS